MQSAKYKQAINEIFALSKVLPSIRKNYKFRIDEENECIQIYRAESYKPALKHGFDAEHSLIIDQTFGPSFGGPPGNPVRYWLIDWCDFHDSSTGTWVEKEYPMRKTILDAFFDLLKKEAANVGDSIADFKMSRHYEKSIQ